MIVPNEDVYHAKIVGRGRVKDVDRGKHPLRMFAGDIGLGAAGRCMCYEKDPCPPYAWARMYA